MRQCGGSDSLIVRIGIPCLLVTFLVVGLAPHWADTFTALGGNEERIKNTDEVGIYTRGNHEEQTRTNKNQQEPTRINKNKQEQTRTNKNKQEQTRTNKNKQEQTRTNKKEEETTNQPTTPTRKITIPTIKTATKTTTTRTTRTTTTMTAMTTTQRKKQWIQHYLRSWGDVDWAKLLETEKTKEPDQPRSWMVKLPVYSDNFHTSKPLTTDLVRSAFTGNSLISLGDSTIRLSHEVHLYMLERCKQFNGNVSFANTLKSKKFVAAHTRYFVEKTPTPWNSKIGMYGFYWSNDKPWLRWNITLGHIRDDNFNIFIWNVGFWLLFGSAHLAFPNLEFLSNYEGHIRFIAREMIKMNRIVMFRTTNPVCFGKIQEKVDDMHKKFDKLFGVSVPRFESKDFNVEKCVMDLKELAENHTVNLNKVKELCDETFHKIGKLYFALALHKREESAVNDIKRQNPTGKYHLDNPLNYTMFENSGSQSLNRRMRAVLNEDEFRDSPNVWLWDRYQLLEKSKCELSTDNIHYPPALFMTETALLNIISLIKSEK